MPRSQGKKCWYSRKGFIKRNTNMKYQRTALMVEKLLARLKFQIELQNETQDKTIMHKNDVDLGLLTRC